MKLTGGVPARDDEVDRGKLFSNGGCEGILGGQTVGDRSVFATRNLVRRGVDLPSQDCGGANEDESIEGNVNKDDDEAFDDRLFTAFPEWTIRQLHVFLQKRKRLYHGAFDFLPSLCVASYSFDPPLPF